MKYRLLGKSGLRVSECCLGSMTFGEEWQFGAPRAESLAIFDAFAKAGGNFIDTANVYTQGSSEKLVGECIRSDRAHFVLSTKYTLSTRHDEVNANGNHRKSLRHAVEDSLQRLGTDYIDILWVHAWDERTPLEESMRALDDLIRAGKVLYIGASNFPAWVLSQANMLAEWRGWSRFIGLQAEYNLIERSAENELIPMAQNNGVSVMGWAPLAGGVLGGNYKLDGQEVHIGETLRGAKMNRERIDHRTMEIVGVVQAIADEAARTPSQVALAWMLQNGKGVIPIIGARTAQQCRENLAALKEVLSDTQMQRLEAYSAAEAPFPQKFTQSVPFRRALFGHTEALLDYAPVAASSATTEIHAIAIITAKPEKRQALEEAFRARLEDTRRKTGCLAYDLAHPLEIAATGGKPANDNDIILVERWQNREALESHLADADYRAWFNHLRPMIETASMQVLQKR